MQITLDIELKDIPGQLILALKPISDFGGNIKTILHHRDKKTPLGKIPVQIVFEIEEMKLTQLIKKLKEKGVEVVRVGKERLKESMIVLLIGHIVKTDITDTINRIDNAGFAEVRELSLSMPDIEKKSSALFMLRAESKENLRKALEILKEIAKKKNILVISSI